MERFIRFKDKLIDFSQKFENFEAKNYLGIQTSKYFKEIFDFFSYISNMVAPTEFEYIIVFMMYSTFFRHYKSQYYYEQEELENLFWKIGLFVFPSMETTMRIPIRIISYKINITLWNSKNTNIMSCIKVESESNLFVYSGMIVLLTEVSTLPAELQKLILEYDTIVDENDIAKVVGKDDAKMNPDEIRIIQRHLCEFLSHKNPITRTIQELTRKKLEEESKTQSSTSGGSYRGSGRGGCRGRGRGGSRGGSRGRGRGH
jgi:uncharacterized membrane protein YgcG